MSDIVRGAFHHIDLNVSDVGASRRVYGTFLEFLGYRLVKDEAEGCEWDLVDEGRGSALGLKACDPALLDHAHRRYAPGLHHLAWRAKSREDVDALHALLVGLGVTILNPPAHYPQYWGNYYAVFFEDPDGMKLEFVHAPGWI
jgi:glyoxylase I family protein